MIADLITYLLAQAAVTAMAGPRLYRQVAPPATPPPYLLVEVPNETRYPHMTAASGLVTAVLTIAAWADSASNADALAAAVRGVLDGRYGYTMGDTWIESITLDDNGESSEAPNDGSAPDVYARTMTFRVSFRETVPSLPA